MEFHYFRSIIGTGKNKEFLFPTLRICRIVSGAFDWQIGASQYPLKQGDVVLLNNLTPRRIINHNPEALQIDIFEFPPMKIQSRPLLVQAFYASGPVIIASGTGSLITDLLTDIAKAYSSVKNRAFYDHILQAVFDLLEEGFCPKAIDTKYSDIAFLAAGFIWENYSENITVPSVAEHLHISKNHLETVFKQVHGISVGAYIRAIRVHQVMALLETDPNRSVLDVALACGFRSSSGFYKAYKAIAGANPRRKHPFAHPDA